jgi:hypothetical protein
MVATIGCLVVLSVIAGCSSGGHGASSDTTAAQQSTAAPDTSTAGPGPTTVASPPPAGTIPFLDLVTDAATDGVSPIGSGCTPTTSSLPDGRWLGRLASVDTTAGTLGLDLECLFTGAAADAAATADGSSSVPVPDNVYLRNNNPRIYELPVVPDVAVGVLTYEKIGGVQFEPTRTGLPAAAALVSRPEPVWIQVVDGWVVAIQQQYLP